MKINLLKIIMALAASLFGFWYSGWIMPHGMALKEDLILFTYNSGFFESYFSRPGCLSTLAGDFFSQFLFNRWSGAFVMAVFMLSGYLLAARTLRRFYAKSTACLTAIIPVGLELLAAGNVFWSLAMPAGWIISVVAFEGCSMIKDNRFWRPAVLFSVAAALYVAVGSAVFVFVALVAAREDRDGAGKLLRAAGSAAAACAVCFGLRAWYMLPVEKAFAYPYSSVGQAWGVIALATMAFASHISFARCEIPRAAASIASLGLAGIFLVLYLNYSPQKVENLLKISDEVARGQWAEALQTGERLQDPIASSYINIALSEQGALGSRMMEFYQPSSSGLFLEVSPSAGWWTIFFASDAYFHVGDLAMAQHSAMLGMIFSPRERSARLVKRLAEICIISGELQAARKYASMLCNTLFHRAEGRQLILQAQSAESFPTITNMRRRIHRRDLIRNFWPPVESLESLALIEENRAARDYLLAFHLLHKNIPAFFNSYTLYYKDSGREPQKVWAEALLIYLAATGAKADELRSLGISSEIVRSFADYTKAHEASGGSLNFLRQRFPGTYWVYYHFAAFK
ncbi:MAG: DUF6057 family protein [Tannerellaceae bacterium]|jgi:hypothetical protein|nr:DUF6057 family protein [Tannerellaceae bacterium]